MSLNRFSRQLAIQWITIDLRVLKRRYVSLRRLLFMGRLTGFGVK